MKDKKIQGKIYNYINKINKLLDGPYKFMEVCGTHTVAIFRTGLRSLFPEFLKHISGPGCPVCVTHPAEIAMGMELAQKEDVILTIFGDMMKVPDHEGRTLKDMRARGANIKICYSPLQSLNMAEENPDKEVVFWGIGFETTAPTVGATVVEAKKRGLKNFSVLSHHKIVPPALKFLVESPGVDIDGFLLPGHVSTIIGVSPYQFLRVDYNIPAVIAGFEPLDIIEAIYFLIEMGVRKKAEIINVYPRAVKYEGNIKAKRIIEEVFEIRNALWRGIGEIGSSGLKISKYYREFDAEEKFSLELREVGEPKGCRCGEVLQGKISPKSCPLFGKRCTPMHPVGPCMVSTEGSCAAYYKYGI